MRLSRGLLQHPALGSHTVSSPSDISITTCTTIASRPVLSPGACKATVHGCMGSSAVSPSISAPPARPLQLRPHCSLEPLSSELHGAVPFCFLSVSHWGQGPRQPSPRGPLPWALTRSQAVHHPPLRSTTLPSLLAVRYIQPTTSALGSRCQSVPNSPCTTPRHLPAGPAHLPWHRTAATVSAGSIGPELSGSAATR